MLDLSTSPSVSFYSHFANELTAECVNDTRNGRSLALANEVEVEHALHGLGLHAAGGWSASYSSTKWFAALIILFLEQIRMHG
jgi:hypothetical protein